MSSKKNRVRVVIVGRANVGKSTLFNRLSEKVKTITYDQEGVTRDFVTDTVSWQGRTFDVVDTGGVSLKKSQDSLVEATRQVALNQLQQADVIIFVVDAEVGIVAEDSHIAKEIHKLGRPVIVAANKCDILQARDRVYEFERFGFKSVISLSAQHGIGIADLLEAIVLLLPEDIEQREEENLSCRAVILGKPNVGKSSLLNLLLKKERAIVADVPGTTREAISEKITFYQEDILLTDTPGVRRKRGVTEDLEQMMVKSSFRALEDADVVILMVDASQGALADQELKLAFYAFEEKHKGVLLLFNKQDLMDDDYQKFLLDQSTELYEHLLKKLPTMGISCKTGKNIGRVMTYIKDLCDRYNQKFDQHELTLTIKEALTAKPLYRNECKLSIHHVQQVGTGPITIALRVNEPKWFGPSQLGYFDRILRKKYDLQGVPIRFLVRKDKIY